MTVIIIIVIIFYSKTTQYEKDEWLRWTLENGDQHLCGLDQRTFAREAKIFAD